jgi:hypothetical protein
VPMVVSWASTAALSSDVVVGKALPPSCEAVEGDIFASSANVQLKTSMPDWRRHESHVKSLQVAYASLDR